MPSVSDDLHPEPVSWRRRSIRILLVIGGVALLIGTDTSRVVAGLLFGAGGLLGAISPPPESPFDRIVGERAVVLGKLVGAIGFVVFGAVLVITSI